MMVVARLTNRSKIINIISVQLSRDPVTAKGRSIWFTSFRWVSPCSLYTASAFIMLFHLFIQVFPIWHPSVCAHTQNTFDQFARIHVHMWIHQRTHTHICSKHAWNRGMQTHEHNHTGHSAHEHTDEVKPDWRTLIKSFYFEIRFYYLFQVDKRHWDVSSHQYHHCPATHVHTWDTHNI